MLDWAIVMNILYGQLANDAQVSTSKHSQPCLQQPVHLLISHLLLHATQLLLRCILH